MMKLYLNIVELVGNVIVVLHKLCLKTIEFIKKVMSFLFSVIKSIYSMIINRL